jgi:hypothetical protein
MSTTLTPIPANVVEPINQFDKLPYPALITNANAWTLGAPSSKQLLWIETGAAIATATQNLDEPIILGAPSTTPNSNSGPAPTLALLNAGTVSVEVTPLQLWDDYEGLETSNPFLDLLHAKIDAIGVNTLNLGVGTYIAGPGSGSSLDIHNFGHLILNGPTIATAGNIAGLLTIENTGTLSGDFAVTLGTATVAGGTISDANISGTNGYRHFAAIKLLSNLGLNVTITEDYAASPGPPEGVGTIEIGGTVAASDVFYLGNAILQLDRPLSFVRPPQAQINFGPYAVEAPYQGWSGVEFKLTDEITAATYNDGILDLDLASKHVLPLKVTLPSPSSWIITETAQTKGIVSAFLQPNVPAGYGPNGPTPITAPTGGALIHVTT